MLLMRIVQLKEKIDHVRKLLYKIARKKGLSHPQVVKASQYLDKLIVQYMKMGYQIKQ